MSDTPFRNQFDAARDPYSARNALGIDSVLASYLTTAAASATYLTIANATTTYATIANFPATAWTSWTPTITAGGGTITSTTINRAKYIQLGKTVTAHVDITITNAGTGVGSFNFTLPIATSSSAQAIVFGREIAATGKMIAGNGTGTTVGAAYYDNTTVITTNNRIVATIIYEVA